MTLLSTFIGNPPESIRVGGLIVGVLLIGYGAIAYISSRRRLQPAEALCVIYGQANDLLLSQDVERWDIDRLFGAARRIEEEAQGALDRHAPQLQVRIDKSRYLYDPDTSPGAQDVFRGRVRYVANQMKSALHELGASLQPAQVTLTDVPRGRWRALRR